SRGEKAGGHSAKGKMCASGARWMRPASAGIQRQATARLSHAETLERQATAWRRATLSVDTTPGGPDEPA
ncbi:MAG: hypothetical protein ACRDZ7_21440, partial [Acidimicrobiia bacterium]